MIEEVIRESSEQLSRIDAKFMKAKSKPTQSEGESSTDAEPSTSFNTIMLWVCMCSIPNDNILNIRDVFTYLNY